MKVLWLCNIMLPKIAEYLGWEVNNKEGWITGLMEEILKQKKEKITLSVCFPMEKDLLGEKEILSETVDGISFYGFFEDVNHAEIYDPGLESSLQKIVDEVKPDVVHIFGTEYPHALAMTKVFPYPERLLIGLQGLCTECAKAYMADLPKKIQNRFLFRDFVKKDNIRMQQKKFFLRGKNEEETLKRVAHIAGRTSWDKRIALSINSKATYHVLGETLRSPFYEGEWKLETCEKYSIFLSQGDYPLKGLHYVLWAMPKLLETYPLVKVYVAGNVITDYKTLKQKIKIGSYGKYCLDLIRQNGLEQKVIFLGRQNAEEMKARYLKSHVFVCPSSLENSPNSVGEAMLLGVPVVCSNVGGIPSLLEDGKEGILYEPGNKKALIDAISFVFSHDEKAQNFSVKERARGRKNHDGEKNFQALMQIYEQMGES